VYSGDFLDPSQIQQIPDAYITDTVAIRRILDHLGLSPPEKPALEVREIVRVPVDDEGREIGASPA